MLHHLAAGCAAIVLLTVARGIGQLQDPALFADIAIHSAILVAAALPLQTGLAVLAMHVLPERMPLAHRAIAGCVCAAIPISIVAPFLSWLAGVMPTHLPEVATREQFLVDWGYRVPFIFGGFATLGTALWMFFNFRWWQTRLSPPAPEPDAIDAPAKPPPAVPGFIRRMPAAKAGLPIAMSAEQHYVRVYTDQGEDLIHMRFSDALKECSSIPGLRVHRSHWARKDAIEEVQSEAGRSWVRVRSGLTLPVSQSYRGAITDWWESRELRR